MPHYNYYKDPNLQKLNNIITKTLDYGGVDFHSINNIEEILNVDKFLPNEIHISEYITKEHKNKWNKIFYRVINDLIRPPNSLNYRIFLLNLDLDGSLQDEINYVSPIFCFKYLKRLLEINIIFPVETEEKKEKETKLKQSILSNFFDEAIRNLSLIYRSWHERQLPDDAHIEHIFCLLCLYFIRTYYKSEFEFVQSHDNRDWFHKDENYKGQRVINVFKRKVKKLKENITLNQFIELCTKVKTKTQLDDFLEIINIISGEDEYFLNNLCKHKEFIKELVEAVKKKDKKKYKENYSSSMNALEIVNLCLLFDRYLNDFIDMVKKIKPEIINAWRRQLLKFLTEYEHTNMKNCQSQEFSDEEFSDEQFLEQSQGKNFLDQIKCRQNKNNLCTQDYKEKVIDKHYLTMLLTENYQDIFGTDDIEYKYLYYCELQNQKIMDLIWYLFQVVSNNKYDSFYQRYYINEDTRRRCRQLRFYKQILKDCE